MPVKDPEVIKQIIRSNFDKSAVLYEDFEQRYGLFNQLTLQLAEVYNVQRGMTVCDVGCGTGTSTFTLANLVGREGLVIGIDFSENMLKVARKNLKHHSNIEFQLCDAELLDEHILAKPDAVLYNACIFLIPRPHKTLHAAYEILKEGGVVGMNYLKGMFGENAQEIPVDNDIDLFHTAKADNLEFAPYGRRITETAILSKTLKDVGFKDIREGATSKKMTREEVKDFYSIPAQSAGLYPKTPYEERLELLDTLLEHIQNSGVTDFCQVWGWCAGVK